MTWTWKAPQLGDPALSADLALGWESRDDAEEWLTSAYTDLTDAGAREVTLVNDGIEEYTMSLESV